MGVYIKGMEMPKDCGECHFCHTEGFESWCCPTEREDILFDAIPEWCPLTEVPDQHGRLIDEDNLIVATKAFLPWSFETEAERGQYFQLDLFKTIIEETPTVIERNK